ncbi:MAG: hypothetical protein KJP11_00515, partial [Gammaproteobacteria bacterium]|nr:hypothetical protein [Gammaproteobacteria bacterium]
FHADLPLARMGVAWGINGFADLGKAVGNALADTQGYETIRRRIDEVLPDAPAAEKVAKIVLDKLCLAID